MEVYSLLACCWHGLGVKRQAGKRGNAVHTPLCVLCAFQKCQKVMNVLPAQYVIVFERGVALTVKSQVDPNGEHVILTAAVYSVRELSQQVILHLLWRPYILVSHQ